MKHYVFDRDHPERAPRLATQREWSEFMAQGDQVLKRTTVASNAGVSTIFLGIDHGFRSPSPVLFETMIFGGTHDGKQWRACFYNEAMRQHEKAVAMAERAETTIRSFLQEDKP